MKRKVVRRRMRISRVGSERMKTTIKDLRKRYGPMLKRLAD